MSQLRGLLWRAFINAAHPQRQGVALRMRCGWGDAWWTGMSEHDLIKGILAHDFATVHVALDAGNGSGGRVLPHDVVLAVVEYGGVAAVAGYHEVVVAELTKEVAVVKVVVGVEQGFLAVVLGDLGYKGFKVANEGFTADGAAVLDVDDGHEVLVFAFDHRGEVGKLLLPVDVRTVEVVTAHAQPHAPCLGEVAAVGVVDERCALGSLEVDVGNLRAAHYFVPIDAALVMRHVDTLTVARVDACVRGGHEECRGVHHAAFVAGLGSQLVGFGSIVSGHALTVGFVLFAGRGLLRTSEEKGEHGG